MWRLVLRGCSWPHKRQKSLLNPQWFSLYGEALTPLQSLFFFSNALEGRLARSFYIHKPARISITLNIMPWWGFGLWTLAHRAIAMPVTFRWVGSHDFYSSCCMARVWAIGTPVCCWVDQLCSAYSAMTVDVISQCKLVVDFSGMRAAICMNLMVTILLHSFIYIVCGHLLAPFQKWTWTGPEKMQGSLCLGEFSAWSRPCDWLPIIGKSDRFYGLAFLFYPLPKDSHNRLDYNYGLHFYHNERVESNPKKLHHTLCCITMS